MFQDFQRPKYPNPWYWYPIVPNLNQVVVSNILYFWVDMIHFDAFFFKLGDKKPQHYIPRNKKQLLASERIAAPTLVVPWSDFSAATSFGYWGMKWNAATLLRGRNIEASIVITLKTSILVNRYTLRKWRWKLKVKVWKMTFLFKQVIFRFYVGFQGGDTSIGITLNTWLPFWQMDNQLIELTFADMQQDAQHEMANPQHMQVTYPRAKKSPIPTRKLFPSDPPFQFEADLPWYITKLVRTPEPTRAWPAGVRGRFVPLQHHCTLRVSIWSCKC